MVCLGLAIIILSAWCSQLKKDLVKLQFTVHTIEDLKLYKPENLRETKANGVHFFPEMYYCVDTESRDWEDIRMASGRSLTVRVSSPSGGIWQWVERARCGLPTAPWSINSRMAIAWPFTAKMMGWPAGAPPTWTSTLRDVSGSATILQASPCSIGRAGRSSTRSTAACPVTR